jgi:hypothetical protein
LLAGEDCGIRRAEISIEFLDGIVAVENAKDAEYRETESQGENARGCGANSDPVRALVRRYFGHFCASSVLLRGGLTTPLSPRSLPT